jgi:hypothetical protein
MRGWLCLWVSIIVTGGSFVLSCSGGSGKEPINPPMDIGDSSTGIDRMSNPADAMDATSPDLSQDAVLPDAATDSIPTDMTGPCETNDDCPSCTSCDLDTGECMPFPCPTDCTTDDDCEPDFICETDAEGCCGHCVQDDPCANVDCIWECDIDTDCDSGDSCIIYGEGCCSECQPQCEICYMKGTTYCPGPAPSENCEIGLIEVEEVGPCWFEITYTGEDGVDMFLADGCVGFSQNLDLNECGLTYDEFGDVFLVACNWCGQVEYSPNFCDCKPDCEGQECGPDGCGGICGSCEPGCLCTADGFCAGCGDDLVELDPLCVHVPSVVQAGQAFAVAVYGETGCMVFDHYEVDTVGTTHNVTLFGKTQQWAECPPADTCSSESWIYSGLIWLDAPNPGGYVVNIGTFSGEAGASGGIIGEPECDEDCAFPALSDYIWTMLQLSEESIAGICLSPDQETYIGETMNLDGTCPDYTLASFMELPDIPATHCTEDRLLFGAQAPYWMEATKCGSNPMVDGHLPIILGTIQDSFGSPLPAQMFVVEGVPLWN